MRLLLFSVLSMTLPAASALATLDCPKLIENAERYRRLVAYVGEVEKPSGFLAGLFASGKKDRAYESLLSELKQVGVEARRDGDKVRFLPGPGHQISRVAKWLEERGIPFVWDPFNTQSSAHINLTGPGDNPFNFSIDQLVLSSYALKKFLLQDSLTNAHVRHELVHIQTIRNRESRKSSQFYGYIEGTTIPDYQNIYSLDEIPAHLETMIAGRDTIRSLHRMENSSDLMASVMTETFRESLNAYRTLYQQTTYLSGFYRRLFEKIERSELLNLKLVRDERGLYFHNETLSTGETFSILLDTGAKTVPPREDILRMVEQRIGWIDEFKRQLSAFASPTAEKLRRAELSKEDLQMGVDQSVKFFQDFIPRLPALQRAVKDAY